MRNLRDTRDSRHRTEAYWTHPTVPSLSVLLAANICITGKESSAERQ